MGFLKWQCNPSVSYFINRYILIIFLLLINKNLNFLFFSFFILRVVFISCTSKSLIEQFRHIALPLYTKQDWIKHLNMEQTLEFLFITLPGVTFLKAHSWDPREYSQIWRLWICLLICYLKLHYVRIFNLLFLIFAFKIKACDDLGFIYVLKQSNFSWITPFRHTRWQLKAHEVT